MAPLPPKGLEGTDGTGGRADTRRVGHRPDEPEGVGSWDLVSERAIQSEWGMEEWDCDVWASAPAFSIQKHDMRNKLFFPGLAWRRCPAPSPRGPVDHQACAYFVVAGEFPSGHALCQIVRNHGARGPRCSWTFCSTGGGRKNINDTWYHVLAIMPQAHASLTV